MRGNILKIICIWKDFPALASISSYFQCNTENMNMVYLIDSRASLQSLHSCKLNIIAWVVESIYLDVVVKVWKFAGWPQ